MSPDEILLFFHMMMSGWLPPCHEGAAVTGFFRTPFDGDFLDALTTFERKIMIYEAQSRETISDSLKIGCVIAGMGQNSMKEHLLMSATKCDSWTNFVREIESIEHARKTITAPTPMDLDAFQGKLSQVREVRTYFERM